MTQYTRGKPELKLKNNYTTEYITNNKIYS